MLASFSSTGTFGTGLGPMREEHAAALRKLQGEHAEDNKVVLATVHAGRI
jgi:hypothetical protein